MSHTDAVAVVGMSARFPGAPDIAAFWELLRSGREAISSFSADELELPSPDQDSPAFVRAHGVLEDIDRFDAEFFTISAREARLLDPQQRLFLEHAWHALEDAGYEPGRVEQTVAVYAGVNFNSYLLSRLAEFDVASQSDIFQVMLASEKDHLATRVAYKLNLRGEAVTVQTSCSTSLVAVHLACQSLLGGQSDLALAGAVSIRVPQRVGYLYQQGMIGSPDGHCRPYDARAAGTVPGNGLAVIALKRLDDALRDRDSVRAVIRGSAINNDGSTKVGYTAPSVAGQASVIAQALAVAEVPPHTIGFVEGHGTATPIGDPVEVEALNKVFRGAPRASIALGSVKSNVGHLDGAAGVAGLIKAILALEHGLIPPTVHLERPNPALRLDDGPFHVNRAAIEWPRGHTPRRCGVSSFGIGGTNAHVVLEEAPVATAAPSRRTHHLLTVSARSDEAVERAAAGLMAHLAAHPEIDRADAAHTLDVGRRRFSRRRFAVATASSPGAIVRIEPVDGPVRIAFLFPGQGAQSIGMGRDLYRAEPEFRDAIDECAELLRPWDLHAALASDDADALAGPERALPALFAVQLASARLWMARGADPFALLGHSFGEYVAACVGGAYSVADGLALALARGRLMQQLPRGGMLAVALGEERVRAILRAPLELAAVNGSDAVTVSGPLDAVAVFEAELRAGRIASRRLPVRHAYHSAAVDGIAAALVERARSVSLESPRLFTVSSVDGRPLGALDAAYFARQMRQPVRFADGLQTLLDAGVNVFVEVAPGRDLTSLVRKAARGRSVLAVASCPPPGGSEQAAMADALGRVWAAGADLDLGGIYRDEPRRRVPLPGYPFERRSHWIAAGTPRASEPASAGSHAAGSASAGSSGAGSHAAGSASAGSSGAGSHAAGSASAGSSGAGSHAAGSASAGSHADASNGLGSHAAGSHAAGPASAGPHAAGSASAGLHVAGSHGAEPIAESIPDRVRAVFGALLGAADLAPGDDIYELGADSLLVTQALARLRGSLDIELSLADLLACRTIGEIAAVVVRASQTPAAQPIAPAPPDQPRALSFAQEWLWLAEQETPGTSRYNFTQAAHTRGMLGHHALAHSLAEVARRHEALRARFPAAGGAVELVIEPAAAVPLPVVDLSQLDAVRRARARHDAARAAARRPFDLAAGPVLRARAIRLAADEHVVLVGVHHIAADAWSMGILAAELGAGYDAAIAGRPHELAQPPAQYSDYAAWQRSRLHPAWLEQLLGHWREALRGAPPVLRLPADRERTSPRQGGGGRRPFRLPAALATAVRELARARGATPFMVLVSGFVALLARRSGQDDFCVGTPVSGRARPETQGLIGCFINTVALRARAGGNPSFEQLLARMREEALAAYAHDEAPFERVVQAVRPPREPGVSPIFQVLFDFQNVPRAPRLSLAGLDVQVAGVDDGAAKLDLILDLWERDGELVGQAEYASDLFDEATIARLLEQYETLLAHATSDPAARLDELRLQTSAGRARLGDARPRPVVVTDMAPAASPGASR